MTIHAFDPGGTTGYARIKVNGKKAIVTYRKHFPDLVDVYALLCGLDPDTNVVVYEKFQFVAANVDPIALEVTGALKVVCKVYSLPLHLQLPSQREIILKRYPQISVNRPKGNHSVTHWWDAALHGLTYAYFKLDCREFEFALP